MTSSVAPSPEPGEPAPCPAQSTPGLVGTGSPGRPHFQGWRGPGLGSSRPERPRPRPFVSPAALAGPWRGFLTARAGVARGVGGGASAPPPGALPTAAALEPTATQLAPEGPFSSQGLSAQSPDAFILGALLGHVLCRRRLEATAPPPPHTHTPRTATPPVRPFTKPLGTRRAPQAPC